MRGLHLAALKLYEVDVRRLSAFRRLLRKDTEALKGRDLGPNLRGTARKHGGAACQAAAGTSRAPRARRWCLAR